MDTSNKPEVCVFTKRYFVTATRCTYTENNYSSIRLSSFQEFTMIHTGVQKFPMALYNFQILYNLKSADVFSTYACMLILPVNEIGSP